MESQFSSVDTVDEDTKYEKKLDKSSFLSNLEIFLLGILAIFFFLLMYALLKICLRIKKVRLLRDYISEKIFYNAIITYIIQSNLRFVHLSLSFMTLMSW